MGIHSQDLVNMHKWIVVPYWFLQAPCRESWLPTLMCQCCALEKCMAFFSGQKQDVVQN